jgi:lysophospholipase L1-like esterase
MTLALRPKAPVRPVFFGQSQLGTPAPPNNSPTFCMATTGLPWGVASLGGVGWEEWTAPLLGQYLYPQARAGLVNPLVMNGGTGDIVDLGRTGAQTYASAIAKRDLAEANGFGPTLITTHLPIGPFYSPTAPMLQAIVDLNALTLANSGGFDAVVDIATDPLDDPTDLTYYAIDQLHVNATGAAVMGQKMRTALLAMLA